MKRKVLGLATIIAISSVLLTVPVQAGPEDFSRHYNSAQEFLEQGQYSSAIVDFRKALHINYLDTSARIGLINSYLCKGNILR